jgi:hypothetical protein
MRPEFYDEISFRGHVQAAQRLPLAKPTSSEVPGLSTATRNCTRSSAATIRAPAAAVCYSSDAAETRAFFRRG